MATHHLPLEPSARALLDAVIAMSSDLDLHSVLHRITRSACELTGASYGALGVVGEDGVFADLITHGIETDRAARIIARVAGTSPPGFPSDHQRTRLFLGVSVRIRDQIFGNLYLSKKNPGVAFTVEDEVLVTALATAAGYVIDNARAFGRSERRRAWLEAAAVLTAALEPPADHEAALQRICDTARHVAGAQAATIVVRDGRSEMGGASADPQDEERVRRAAEALAESVQLPIDDHVEQEVEGMYAVGVPLRSALTGRHTLLVFYDHHFSIADSEERDLLAAFADQAALALDRVRAVDDRADLAVISDRERIARDLHDVVIQRLFATGIQLQALGQLVTDPDVARRLSNTVDSLDLTIKDVRGTIFELQSRDEGSLRAEVREVVREYVGGLGFTPVVRTVGPIDTAVPEHVRAHLLPVLREAVSNLARHAFAEHAEIELSVSENALMLTVADDGVGLAADRRESGIRNARRRAAELGGTFGLTAHEPRGTSFVWRVPLTAPS